MSFPARKKWLTPAISPRAVLQPQTDAELPLSGWFHKRHDRYLKVESLPYRLLKVVPLTDSLVVHTGRFLAICVSRRSREDANRFRSARLKAAGPPWTKPPSRNSIIKSLIESRSPIFSSV